MPAVTVSDVVRFALPAGATVLAGGAGLDQAVTWARLLRARPPTLASVDQDEVWLLSAGALLQAGEPRAVARLLRETADAGVVALIVQERPAEEALTASNEVAVPLVLLPGGASLPDIERAIVGLVTDRDRAIAARVQEIYDRLLATLVEDRGPELLATIVHEVTGKAVYLLDEHFQPTVQAGGDARSAAALAELRRRQLDGNPLWGGAPAAGERLVSLRGARASDEGANLETLAALVRPLLLRGAVAGYLALIGDRDEFTDFDHQVAGRTASVLAIELAKQSAVVEARLRIQGDFLSALLDTPGPLNPQVTQHARSLGYDLTQPHLVFALRPRPGCGDDGQRAHGRMVDVARRRLVLANTATLLRECEGRVEVLTPYPPEIPADNPDEAVAWVERLRTELEAALAPDTVPITAGVGRVPGLSDGVTHHAALREAIQAAEIAATLPAGSATLHFAHLGALRLIFQLAGTPELQAYQRDVLGPLEEYDQQHRSDFVQTLEAFFAAGGNHVQAARALHVHRNTLIYRLDRIREVLGNTDLDDPDTRLNLQLALKIRSAFGGQG